MFLNELPREPQSLKDFTVGSKWAILEQRRGVCSHLTQGTIIEIRYNRNNGLSFNIEGEDCEYYRYSFKDGWLRRNKEDRPDHYQDIRLRRHNVS